MGDLATAHADFLVKVEVWAPGRAKRFAPVMDELIRWAEEKAWGVQFSRHDGSHEMVNYLSKYRSGPVLIPPAEGGSEAAAPGEP